jgi:hypothetical protein
MKSTQSWLHPLAIGSILSLSVGFATQPDPIQAQGVPTLDRSSAFRLTLPQPPKDPRAPQGRQKGGSSRGGGDDPLVMCREQAQPPTEACPSVAELTALVPATEGPDQEKFVWGLTTAERPTLWFMVPELDSAPVEFILQDEEDRYIHKANFILPHPLSRGVIQIDVPDSAPALEFNKRYTWTLAITATPNHANMFVQGTIYRVPLATSLKQPIKQATGLEKVMLYAQHGLWHDAIASLAKLRQSNPQDARVKTAWFNLLNQAKLGEIARQPLLPCCTAKSRQKTYKKPLNSQD